MKTIMSLLAVLTLVASTAQAQETKAEEYNTVREYRNKVFTVQNRDARQVGSAVKLLGSGFKGAALSVNEELRTITVRDFPENVAAIEEAIKRLDVPLPEEPDMEMKISILIGSKTPLPGALIPDDLAPVIKQLKATLSYPHYGLMTANVHRTKAASGIEGSGVAEPALLGMTAVQDRPLSYSYRLRNVRIASAGGRRTVDIGNFTFSILLPVNTGSGGVQYSPIGFETPVSLRENEKVVIGTTTMRDKALIVVVTATVDRN